MYTVFFGLSEVPFSIAPNPHYLFMSDRHREALAHLTYGLGETGGFVLLTGEVGTGKTTVSRCLLEQLPEHTQAAFILNPTLSSQELLATICDELKIRYRKTGATLKTLTDKIQQKLINNHQAGLNTVLIIDEAQHLKAEVLEQLRLLTNLETHTKKLLQVILIGQPELQKLLQRQDLRQLAQRITARYHLLPLTKTEVAQYISHRLSVANCTQVLFSPQAIATAHQLSNGIPRLINLLCDRALLGAYGENKPQVSRKIMLAAGKEVLGEGQYHSPSKFKLTWAIWLAAILMLTTLGWWWHTQPIASVKSVAQVHQPAIDNSLIEQNRGLAPALQALFSLWHISVDDNNTQPCEQASSFSLACYWYKGNLTALVKLHYPAILKLYDQQGQAFYATLIGVDWSPVIPDNQLHLRFEQHQQSIELVVNSTWLAQYWRGGALVFWQPPKDQQGHLVVELAADNDAALWQWLEQKLSKLQQRPMRAVTDFDRRLRNQLAQFQRQHGLLTAETTDKVVVSQETLMALANQVTEGLPIFEYHTAIKPEHHRN